MPLCGGASELRPADDDIKLVVAKIKAQFEEQFGKACATFEAVGYRSQVVAGINYFVKVHTGEEKFAHLRVFQPLPGQGELRLVSFQDNKAHDDELSYF